MVARNITTEKNIKRTCHMLLVTVSGETHNIFGLKDMNSSKFGRLIWIPLRFLEASPYIAITSTNTGTSVLVTIPYVHDSKYSMRLNPNEPHSLFHALILMYSSSVPYHITPMRSQLTQFSPHNSCIISLKNYIPPIKSHQHHIEIPIEFDPIPMLWQVVGLPISQPYPFRASLHHQETPLSARSQGPLHRSDASPRSER